MTRSLFRTSLCAALIVGALTLRASAAGDLNFDQGVDAAAVLAASREEVRSAPAPRFESVEIAPVAAAAPRAQSRGEDTYTEREILEAITDLGGDISGSVADIIAAVFQKAGRPTGVIVGEEIQGSFIVGYRQGKGRVKFKNADAAPRKIVWRAPSIGFNVGASANKVTMLIYNARDYESLLRTFGSIQGSYHFILGGGVTYMQSGGVNLAHVAIGVGVDAGVAVEGLTFRRN